MSTADVTRAFTPVIEHDFVGYEIQSINGKAISDVEENGFDDPNLAYQLYESEIESLENIAGVTTLETLHVHLNSDSFQGFLNKASLMPKLTILVMSIEFGSNDLDTSQVIEAFPNLEKLVANQINFLSPTRSANLTHLEAKQDQINGLENVSFPNLNVLITRALSNDDIAFLNQQSFNQLIHLGVRGIEYSETIEALSAYQPPASFCSLSLGNLYSSHLENLTLTASWTTQISQLNLSSLGNDECSIGPYVNKDHFPALKFLDISPPLQEYLEISWVLEDMNLPEGVHLSLNRCWLSDSNITHLANMPVFKHIASLNLDYNCLAGYEEELEAALTIPFSADIQAPPEALEMLDDYE